MALIRFTQVIRWLAVAVALGCELETPHRFHVEREQVGLRAVEEAHAHGPVLIGAVPRFVVERLVRDVFDEEAAVFDVAVELIRVHVPPARVAAIAPEPGERADAGFAFVVDDIVAVVGVFLAAVLVDKAGQAEFRAKFAQHGLEPAHIAVRFDHWPADRVGGGIGFADGTVEQRNAVVPFEICRVG